MSQLRGGRGLVLLWGLTGLLNLILNATTPNETTRGLQMAALLVAVFGTLAWLMRALGINSARDAAFIIAPALGALFLGLFVLPSLLLPLLGAALGWLVVVCIIATSASAGGATGSASSLAARRLPVSYARAGWADPRERRYGAPALARADFARLGQARPCRARKRRRSVTTSLEDAAAHNLLAEARMQSGDMWRRGEPLNAHASWRRTIG